MSVTVEVVEEVAVEEEPRPMSAGPEIVEGPTLVVDDNQWGFAVSSTVGRKKKKPRGAAFFEEI